MNDNINKTIIRSQNKSSTALILSILCFVFGEWIAMIFFIMAYSNYENLEDLLVLNNTEMAQVELSKAKKNMRLGIVIAIICFIIGLIIGTALLIGYINLLSQ